MLPSNSRSRGDAGFSGPLALAWAAGASWPPARVASRISPDPKLTTTINLKFMYEFGVGENSQNRAGGQKQNLEQNSVLQRNSEKKVSGSESGLGEEKVRTRKVVGGGGGRLPEKRETVLVTTTEVGAGEGGRGEYRHE
jgi:hypothetical protein